MAISSAVAARRGSSPITYIRSTECPTRAPTLRARSSATASSIPPNDSPQRQSTPLSNAASGISSMSRNIRENRSRWAGRTGARLSEQLPVTTDVTPCSIAGKAYGSKHSWAS